MRERPAPLRVRTDDLPPPVEVVRELPGPGALVAAVRCILLTALVGLLAFACGALTGCGDGGASRNGTSMGKRIYDAFEDAWYAHSGNLPPVNDELADCERLPLLELLTPATQAEYLKRCPANSNGCLRWLPLDRRVRNIKYPVAIMSPKVAADRWPALAVHEVAHAFMTCADMPTDYLHADKRVWRPAADSVEAVSVRALYEPREE